jgi:hypothetical protein
MIKFEENRIKNAIKLQCSQFPRPRALRRKSWSLERWDLALESRLSHGCFSSSFWIVLSFVGRGLWDGLITSPKEVYRVYKQIMRPPPPLWGGHCPHNDYRATDERMQNRSGLEYCSCNGKGWLLSQTGGTVVLVSRCNETDVNTWPELRIHTYKMPSLSLGKHGWHPSNCVSPSVVARYWPEVKHSPLSHSSTSHNTRRMANWMFFSAIVAAKTAVCMRRTIRTIDQKMVAVHGSYCALFALILMTILFLVTVGLHTHIHTLMHKCTYTQLIHKHDTYESTWICRQKMSLLQWCIFSCAMLRNLYAWYLA